MWVSLLLPENCKEFPLHALFIHPFRPFLYKITSISLSVPPPTLDNEDEILAEKKCKDTFISDSRWLTRHTYLSFFLSKDSLKNTKSHIQKKNTSPIALDNWATSLEQKHWEISARYKFILYENTAAPALWDRRLLKSRRKALGPGKQVQEVEAPQSPFRVVN